MENTLTTSTRGILNPRTAEKKFRLTRHFPSPDLSFFIARYWIIHWDLRGQPPFVQETLPYPCVNLVFEQGNTRVWGVDTGRFVRRLDGSGQVFGVKFKPGGYYPFVKRPVSAFTDSTHRLCDAFGTDPDVLDDVLFALDDDEQIGVVEDFLREHLPEPDENVVLVNQVVDCIMSDPRITKVDDIAASSSMSKRTLQRLFNQYVGVSPKWVIQRFRIHEATEQMASGAVRDWSKLAQTLGYFDQAHFIKDFKAVVGKTPAEYARSLAVEA